MTLSNIYCFAYNVSDTFMKWYLLSKLNPYFRIKHNETLNKKKIFKKEYQNDLIKEILQHYI